MVIVEGAQLFRPGSDDEPLPAPSHENLYNDTYSADIRLYFPPLPNTPKRNAYIPETRGGVFLSPPPCRHAVCEASRSVRSNTCRLAQEENQEIRRLGLDRAPLGDEEAEPERRLTYDHGEAFGGNSSPFRAENYEALVGYLTEIGARASGGGLERCACVVA